MKTKKTTKGQFKIKEQNFILSDDLKVYGLNGKKYKWTEKAQLYFRNVPLSSILSQINPGCIIIYNDGNIGNHDKSNITILNKKELKAKGYKQYKQTNIYAKKDGSVYSLIGQVLKPLNPKHNIGYLQVKDKEGNPYYIHRIIAELFVKGYKKGKEVNHIDFDKRNNSASNLEWLSKTENLHHYTNNRKRSRINFRYFIDKKTNKKYYKVLDWTKDNEVSYLSFYYHRDHKDRFIFILR